MSGHLSNVSIGAGPIALPEPAGSRQTASGTAPSFAEAISAAIGHVESLQKEAKTTAAELLGGGQGDVYEVALASQRADLSLELFQQVRNKFVQAYQEIMRMQM